MEEVGGEAQVNCSPGWKQVPGLSLSWVWARLRETRRCWRHAVHSPSTLTPCLEGTGDGEEATFAHGSSQESLRGFQP